MPEGLRSLALIVQSGDFDRVHYAFVLAAGAAATNRPVTLFFTGQALHVLVPEGWRRLGGDAEAQERRLEARGLATLAALREACAELGVRLIACELGLRMADIPAASLDPALGVEIAGVVTLFNAVPPDGHLLLL